ncbi:SprT family zinc-dependent metalloprotease [Enterobacter quasihormaechei]|uniref:M48 family metallopeptidase n=1 Tax=Enterobacter quasihormaechei TaxID=2529382 RepID=UPI002FCEFEFF
MPLVTFGGLTLDLQRKPIKNLHISVLPPDGRVRVSAPVTLSDTAIRMAVVRRLVWIRQQQAQFQAQPRQSEREMCSGETHYLWGRGYRLDVVLVDKPAEVKLQGGWIRMKVPPHYKTAQREAVLNQWYRGILKQRLPKLMAKWQQEIKVEASYVGIKRMKTKWGSCNPQTARIWINLELVKKPPECLEFIVVHELVHLHERKHNEHFIGLMNMYLPNWREHRAKLNKMPLSYNHWGY